MRYNHFSRIIALALVATVALAAGARTVTVSMSSIKSNLTTELRKVAKQLTYNDTAILDFDQAGEYTLNGTVEFKCNVTMQGLGASKTVLVLNKGTKTKSFWPFTDDCFISIYGSTTHSVTVSITNLGIKLKDHSGIWWEGDEKYALKIYHGNNVVISNVTSEMANAAITNFDLRVCSNVNIHDCTIANYNNCSTGGNIWVRGNCSNITIKNNKIYKYGNDEAVAFISKTVDAYKNINGNIQRNNIQVTDNEFYYQHKDKTTNGMFNDMLFSLLAGYAEQSYQCKTTNLQIARNKFVINDLCKRVLYFYFDEYSSNSGIIVSDNQIISNRINSSEQFYRNDVDMTDLSSRQDVITFKNNTVTNNHVIMTPYGSSGYTFISLNGGKALLQSNHITSKVTTDSRTGKTAGINLIGCGAKGGTVTLKDNICTGLSKLANIEAGEGVKQFTINATGNTFKGDTRIYCNNLTQLDLNFTGNTFESDNMNFFLQEFASKGSLVFNNNNVTVKSGKGQLMTHWSKSKTGKFTTLEVQGNTFKGVSNQSDLLRNMTNVSKRSIQSNTFK